MLWFFSCHAYSFSLSQLAYCNHYQYLYFALFNTSAYRLQTNKKEIPKLIATEMKFQKMLSHPHLLVRRGGFYCYCNGIVSLIQPHEGAGLLDQTIVEAGQKFSVEFVLNVAGKLGVLLE